MLRLNEVQLWWQERAPAVLVEVIQTEGSVPRGPGTRMLVSRAGSLGTIGGGHLEWQALDAARRLLRDGVIERQTQRYALGPALGQCCGGTVMLAFELLSEAHLSAWPTPTPLFHLSLFGAGHVGRAIARLLVPLCVAVRWIDERDDEFPASLGLGPWPQHISRVAVDAVEAEVALAPAQSFYLVLTHQHDLDLRLAATILRRQDVGFFGLIGSRTKRQRFCRRLTDRGLEALERMVCPIGLPGIQGKEPEVIALSVVAQMLMKVRLPSVDGINEFG